MQELVDVHIFADAHSILEGPARHDTRSSLVCLMQELVDVHIFADAHGILEGLARHDCGAALHWCGQHRARLRKIRSKLEFMLHIQVRLRGLPPAHRL